MGLGGLYEAFVLLLVLPLIEWCRHSYWFAALPLHVYAQGWDYVLGLTAADTGSLALRIAMHAFISRTGDWVVLPLTTVVACATVPMLVWPDDPVAVYAGVTASSVMFTPQVFKTLAFRRYGDEHARYRRALRCITVSEVFGYSLASFLAGTLFQFSGWRGCAALQLACSASTVILLGSLPVFWEVAREVYGRSPARDGVSAHDREAEVKAGPVHRSARSRSLLWLPPSIRTPVVLVLMMQCINVMSYSFEWKIFALFFQEVYDWEPVWIGVGQGAGDLIAAFLLLGLALRQGCSVAAEEKPPPRILSCCLPLPLNISALLAFQIVLIVLFVLPNFGLAVTGQVLIGTSYVLSSQALQEALAIYAAGHEALYRQLAFLNAFVYNGGTLVGSFTSLVLYSASPRLPMYIAAALLFPATCAFTAYFCRRLRWAGTGIHDGLAKMEMVLAQAATPEEVDRAERAAV